VNRQDLSGNDDEMFMAELWHFSVCFPVWFWFQLSLPLKIENVQIIL